METSNCYDADNKTKYEIFITSWHISYSGFKFVLKTNSAISILFAMKPPATECPVLPNVFLFHIGSVVTMKSMKI
jgi:hypothetical protein